MLFCDKRRTLASGMIRLQLTTFGLIGFKGWFLQTHIMNDFLLRVRFISKLRHYPLLIVQRIISSASIKYIRLLLKFILNLITSIFTSRFTSGEYIEKCFRGKKKKIPNYCSGKRLFAILRYLENNFLFNKVFTL